MAHEETSKPAKQWVAGNAAESAMFSQARACAAKIGTARQSKILWTGNAAIFLAGALLATPEGAPLINATFNFAAIGAHPFEAICTMMATYSGLKAAEGWWRELAGVSKIVDAVDKIETPLKAVMESARRAEREKVSKETIFALAALSVSQDEKAQQLKAKPRGPR